MSMNPDLQPVKRADKNGNIVTRWIRSFRKSAEPTTPLPAPELKVTDSSKPYYHQFNLALEESRREQLSGYDPYGDDDIHIDYKEVDRLQKEINAETERVKTILFPDGNTYRDNDREYNPESLRENLSLLIRHAPELLDKVIASCNRNEMLERDYWANLISSSTLYPTSARETNESVDHFLNYYRVSLGTISCMNRLKDEGLPLVSNDWETVSIWKYQSQVDALLETHRSMGKSFSEETAEATALFAYIRDWYHLTPFDIRDTPSVRYEANKEDIEYMAQNLESVYSVLPELLSRGVTDSDLIKAMIESPASVLNEGEL